VQDRYNADRVLWVDISRIGKTNDERSGPVGCLLGAGAEHRVHAGSGNWQSGRVAVQRSGFVKGDQLIGRLQDEDGFLPRIRDGSRLERSVKPPDREAEGPG
jgi:hypothetical protein